MSDLSRFLKKNKIQKENGFFAPTTSITDENGKPLEWEFKHISSKDNERLRDDATLDIPIRGKANMYRTKVDISKYIANIIVASVVHPNLYNKELQDSYGVVTPHDLLYALVDDPGEYAELCSWIQKFQGFDEDIDDKVKEAKN